MTYKSVNRKAGFSLLELSVIMFLIMILLGFALPRFPRLFESDLQLETQKMARLIDNLRQEAILNAESYKLIIDTKKSVYSVLTAPSDQPGQYSPHIRFGKPISLTESVSFVGVSTFDQQEDNLKFAGRKITFDKIFGQTFEVKIDSSGFIDLFTVRLKDQNNQLSLSVVNIMGKINIGEELSL